MSFAGLMDEHRRLCLIRALAEDGDYTANDSFLAGILTAYGNGCSRDHLRAQLAWLEEQRLIRRSTPDEGRTVVVTLTDRGLDVAQGRAMVPGVQRPGPGSAAAAVMHAATKPVA